MRLINLSGRAGPSGAKPREFERKIYFFIYICVYMFISLKVSAQWRQPVWRHLEQNLHTSKKICVHDQGKFQLQCSSIFTGHRTTSPGSFPFLLEIFFVKEYIKEITRFVAAVNNFPWEINSSNTTALHARCTLRRDRNRFSTAN